MKNPFASKIKKDDLKLISLLKHHNINVVLDVGANVGQYATSIRRAGYDKKIISFEPLQKNNDALKKLCANDITWSLHDRCAVGEEAGSVDINVSESNDMSSILNIDDKMTEALPKSRYVTTEKVDVITIDSTIDAITNQNDNVFIKIDTQGFENAVIQGALKSLTSGKIIGVQLELSMLPLYSGEVTYDSICKKMADLGFETHLIISGYYSKKLNRQLQADFVFFKKTMDSNNFKR